MAFVVLRQPLAPAWRLAATLAPAQRSMAPEEVCALRTADELLRLAHEQADRIALEAQESFERERERGYREGLEQAKLEQTEQMIENVSRTVDYFSAVETRMVDLVMQTVRKIISDFDDEERVLIAVRNALSVVRHQKTMTLRVRGQQVDAVKQRINDILAAFPGVGYLDIVADNRLGADACIVESEIGTVEASIEGQLQALQQAFVKVLGSRV